MALRLLSYNIRFGGIGRTERLAQVIRDAAPDMVVFQEATDPSVVQALAAATGLTVWAAQRAYSVAFISRVAVTHFQWHFVRGSRHRFLEIVHAPSGARIFGVHLRPEFSKWGEARRVIETKRLLESIAIYQSGLHLLVGDFNTLAPGEILNIQRMPAWIRALLWFSGRDMQRDVVKLMLSENYLDGFRTLHPDVKGYTFPTWDPHLRLDYAFLPAQYMLCLRTCEVIQSPQAAQASDHFPLLAELDL